MSRAARTASQSMLEMPILSRDDMKQIRESEIVRRKKVRDERNQHLKNSGIIAQDIILSGDERGSPDSSEALMLKIDNTSVLGEELTEAEYYNILKLFTYNLQNEKNTKKYDEFKADLDKTLEQSRAINKELSETYNYEKGSRLIIIFVFVHILPNLLKTSIPPYISSIVIYFLNLYNVQLMIYYYRVFLDSSNPGIKKLQAGEQFNAKIAIELSTHALEISKNSTFFSNIDVNTGKFSPCITLIKIKNNIVSFMNKYNVYMNDDKNRLRFVFLYFALFLIMLYFAIHYENELKDMFNLIMTPTTPYRQPRKSNLPLINQAPRVKLHNSPSSGGKKVRKSNKSKKSV
jgi:hypothetical protein